jgi:hypothetical protein
LCWCWCPEIGISSIDLAHLRIIFSLFLMGWDWVHLVLRPLLAYRTSPGW